MLIKKFCRICLEPHKYHRYVAARRRDDYTSEQMLQSVANNDQELSDQIFETIIEISKDIVLKSHKLTSDYVEMDLKLREIERNEKENSSGSSQEL